MRKNKWCKSTSFKYQHDAQVSLAMNWLTRLKIFDKILNEC